MPQRVLAREGAGVGPGSGRGRKIGAGPGTGRSSGGALACLPTPWTAFRLLPALPAPGFSIAVTVRSLPFFQIVVLLIFSYLVH